LTQPHKNKTDTNLEMEKWRGGGGSR
jgi:hypothetical protein